MQDEPTIEIEVSQKYIKDRQTDGMWHAMRGLPPEFPECPHYMMGYRSIR